MNWIFAIATLVAFIIIGFILLIFMPKAQVFFDLNIPELKNLETNHDEIKKEVLDNLKDPIKPVIPIYGDREIKSIDYPRLYEILQTIPDIRYAGILNLKPKFNQIKQYGFAPVSNYTLRCFYTLSQSATHKSGVWIDGQTKFFTEKEMICGDMSREYSLFNKNRYNYSTVLFIDIDRSDHDNTGNSPNNECICGRG
jgi:hypothetical protein